MAVEALVREVFGYFQNLNLLGLMQDLRQGQAARGAWSSGNRLCPVAHGLATGRHVREAEALVQASFDPSHGCNYAARALGADPWAVFRFVRFWDEGPIYSGWLLRQLEELWDERLADANAVQEVLHGATGCGSGHLEGEPLAEACGYWANASPDFGQPVGVQGIARDVT
jgi:hypothetical protein